MAKQPFQTVPGPFSDVLPGTIDEQATQEAFEDYVGGPTKAFRLMNLYREAGYTVNGDKFKICPPKRTQASVFIKMAEREGFTKQQAEAFLML